MSDVQRTRSPIRHTVGLLTGFLLAAGCASTPEGSPPPTRQAPPRLTDCPAPTPVTSLGPAATGLRMRNETGQALLVFLAECRGHRRLGTVLPDRARLFGLPSTVFLRDGQVVVHAFTQDPSAFYASYRQRPGPDTVRLAPTTIAAEAATPELSVGPSFLSVEVGEFGSQIVVEDRTRAGRLRLRCEGPDPRIDLGGQGAPETGRQVVFDLSTGERVATGPWRGGADGWRHAPEAFVADLVRVLRLPGQRELYVRVEGVDPAPTFSLEGVDEAVALLPCISTAAP